MDSGMLGKPVAAYRGRREPHHAALPRLFDRPASRRSQVEAGVLWVGRLVALIEVRSSACQVRCALQPTDQPQDVKDLAVALVVMVEQPARSHSPSSVSVCDRLRFTSTVITATVATDVDGSRQDSSSSTPRPSPPPTRTLAGRTRRRGTACARTQLPSCP